MPAPGLYGRWVHRIRRSPGSVTAPSSRRESACRRPRRVPRQRAGRRGAPRACSRRSTNGRRGSHLCRSRPYLETLTAGSGGQLYSYGPSRAGTASELKRVESCCPLGGTLGTAAALGRAVVGDDELGAASRRLADRDVDPGRRPAAPPGRSPRARSGRAPSAHAPELFTCSISSPISTSCLTANRRTSASTAVVKPSSLSACGSRSSQSARSSRLASRAGSSPRLRGSSVFARARRSGVSRARRPDHRDRGEMLHRAVVEQLTPVGAPPAPREPVRRDARARDRPSIDHRLAQRDDDRLGARVRLELREDVPHMALHSLG